LQNIDVCETCGVPLYLSGVARWESNGVISCALLPGGRGIFYECEAINGLFQSLEGLLGLSIEHILMESVRRDVREFMENFLSAQISEALTLPIGEKGKRSELGDQAKLTEMREKQKAWNIQAITMGSVFGYGDARLGEEWETGDRHPWRYQIIRDPYSIFFYAAAAIGTVEAFEKRDMWARYESIGENAYKITVFPQSHYAGLAKRLQAGKVEKTFKSGDISYERCPRCGIPSEISRHDWNLAQGTITDPDSGRRMVFIPTACVEAILADLEAELGEEVPRVLIEAQRRTMKSLLAGENWSRSGWVFKPWIGSRGMGNLVHFKAAEKSLSVRIENSCVPALMVGFCQALAELAFGVESSGYQWNLSEDGDLSIHILV